jgi:hypothetical protein
MPFSVAEEPESDLLRTVLRNKPTLRTINIKQVGRQHLALDPLRHQRLELAEAVVRQRRGHL